MSLSPKKDLRSILEEFRTLPDFAGVELASVNTKGHFGNTPLHLAAVRGELIEVKCLLDHGAEIDAQGEHGNTPLHEAILQGHFAIVKLLLQRGASTKIVNNAGQHASDCAKQCETPEIQALFQ